MSSATLRQDVTAGITVALVTIPQCMAIAAVAGLPPVAGLYAAFVMAVVTALLASSPTLNVGPTMTISTMVLAVLASVAPGQTDRWLPIAGGLAILVGLFTLALAALRVGQFVRFVSRSVLVGLTASAAVIIIGSQVGPFAGITPQHRPTLIQSLIHVASHLHEAKWAAVAVATSTGVCIAIISRLSPRAPAPFIAIAVVECALWLVRSAGVAVELPTVGDVPRRIPTALLPLSDIPFSSELIVGAASMATVSIIQTLSISRALASQHERSVDTRRDLIALGAANMTSGLLHGFPGAGSFVRTALNDLAGARTRMAGMVNAVAVALIVVLAAPLASQISKASIAGLLTVTAISMVNWRDFIGILREDKHDRIVLSTMMLSVLVLPIHWVVLIGLAMSVALFLRRASRLHLVEMVEGDDDQYREQPIDDQTGRSPITMLQLEGPLFFAHADEIAAKLGAVFRRGPAVTIIRMRRTQQIDFSAIAAMARAIRKYQEAGGRLILCGLSPEMHRRLRDSEIGELLPAGHMMRTTHKVFGSAHQAARMAREMVEAQRGGGEALFRQVVEREPAPTREAATNATHLFGARSEP